MKKTLLQALDQSGVDPESEERKNFDLLLRGGEEDGGRGIYEQKVGEREKEIQHYFGKLVEERQAHAEKSAEREELRGRIQKIEVEHGMLRAELSELAREDTELEKNAAERRAQIEMDIL